LRDVHGELGEPRVRDRRVAQGDQLVAAALDAERRPIGHDRRARLALSLSGRHQ